MGCFQLAHRCICPAPKHCRSTSWLSRSPSTSNGQRIVRTTASTSTMAATRLKPRFYLVRRTSPFLPWQCMPGSISDCRYAWSRAPHTSHTQGTPCVRCPCSLQRACCVVHSVARGPSANQEGLALCQAHSRAMVSTLEHPRALYRGHLEHPIALYAGRRHLRRRTGSCCRCCRCNGTITADRISSI